MRSPRAQVTCTGPGCSTDVLAHIARICDSVQLDGIVSEQAGNRTGTMPFSDLSRWTMFMENAAPPNNSYTVRGARLGSGREA